MKHCAVCGCKLKAGRRKFCCNKHKDRWHNIHNPRGYYRNASRSEDYKDADCDMHPFDSEALGQE